jgi:hypothetical protein
MNRTTCIHPSLEEGSSGLINESIRKVRFGEIEIHEFGTEMGGSVPSEGCPIALNWIQVAYHVCSVDQYENERSNLQDRTSLSSFDPRKKAPLSRKQQEVPVISAHRRAKMLHACGYSLEEIVEVAIEMDDIRRQRRDSLEKKRLDGFHYALEVSGRTLRKVVSLKPNFKRNVQSAKMA